MELSKEGGCTLMSKTREQIITHDELYYIDVAKQEDFIAAAAGIPER